MEFSRATRAPPTHIAPSLKRPTLRMLKAITCPLPISPSTFSAGTLQSFRMMGQVDDPRMPILCSSAPMENPGKLFSTKNAVKKLAVLWLLRGIRVVAGVDGAELRQQGLAGDIAGEAIAPSPERAVHRGAELDHRNRHLTLARPVAQPLLALLERDEIE